MKFNQNWLRMKTILEYQILYKCTSYKQVFDKIYRQLYEYRSASDR